MVMRAEQLGDDRPKPRRLSEVGIISCLLAALMIVLEFVQLINVMRGVKDNQGYVGAAFVSLDVLMFGFPFCFLLGLAGLFQPNRDDRSALWGLCTSAGAAPFRACGALCGCNFPLRARTETSCPNRRLCSAKESRRAGRAKGDT
jgi:hypothetical protein